VEPLGIVSHSGWCAAKATGAINIITSVNAVTLVHRGLIRFSMIRASTRSRTSDEDRHEEQTGTDRRTHREGSPRGGRLSPQRAADADDIRHKDQPALSRHQDRDLVRALLDELAVDLRASRQLHAYFGSRLECAQQDLEGLPTRDRADRGVPRLRKAR
jgi:hypothetical protein